MPKASRPSARSPATEDVQLDTLTHALDDEALKDFTANVDIHQTPVKAVEDQSAGNVTSSALAGTDRVHSKSPQARSPLARSPTRGTPRKSWSPNKSPPQQPSALLSEDDTCLVTGLMPKVTMREAAQRFTIEVVNRESGSRVAHSGLHFAVNISGVSRARSHVQDNLDGTYCVEWQPHASGHYKLLVSHKGSALNGSPFSVFVSTPEPCTAKCKLRGASLTHAVSRAKQSFEVAYRDLLDTITHAVELDVFVEPVPAGSPRAAPQRSRRGRRTGRSSPSLSSARRSSSDGRVQVHGRTSPNWLAQGRTSPSMEGRLSPSLDAEQRPQSTGDQWSPPSTRQRRAVEGGMAGGKEGPSWTPPTSQRTRIYSSEGTTDEVGTTRFRRIRVRVHQKLIVRAGVNQASEMLGQLLPGSIVTVIEERVISPGNVRACVSLDMLDKDGADANPSARSSPTSTSRRYTPRETPKAFDQPVRSTRRVTVTTRETPRLKEGTKETARNETPRPALSTRRVTMSTRETPRAAPGSRETPRSVLKPTARKPEGPLTIHQEPALSDDLTREASMLLSEAMKGPSNTDPGSVQEGVEEDSRAQSDAAGAPAIRRGAAHSSKKMQVSGLALSAGAVGDSTDATGAIASKRSQYAEAKGRNARPRITRGTDQRAEQLTPLPRVGWVTLMKSGRKLVTSRLRLNPNARMQYRETWAQRNNNEAHAEALCGFDLLDEKEMDAQGSTPEKDGVERLPPSKGAVEERGSPPKMVRGDASALLRRYSLERQGDDVSSFAFGGVYPGTLHAHGLMHEWHRVSYSIGVAGQYLLHVRLRHQATSLPGSPFMLTVEPANAFALSSELQPRTLTGEVGTAVVTTLHAADRMGNASVRGGDNVRCWNEATCVDATVNDLKNGTYEVSCTSTKAGSYHIDVTIDGRHVIGSPFTAQIFSTIPVVANSKLSGQGLSWARVNEATTVKIKFLDRFQSDATPNEDFRGAMRIGMRLLSASKQMVVQASKKSDIDESLENEVLEELQGGWVGPGEYEATYRSSLTGAHRLHLYCVTGRDADGKPQMELLPGCPFKVNVENSVKTVTTASSNENERGDVEVESGDYIITRTVFDESQKRWGTCTIDAFASAATALLPNFWSFKPHAGCAGTNAFAQRWGPDDRIWAHPPTSMLMTLVQFLSQQKRKSEVIVCAPDWPKFGWYKLLEAMSDDQYRYGSGKLQAVAGDAPARCNEWPLVLFRIPAVGRLSPEEKQDVAVRVIQRCARDYLHLEQPAGSGKLSFADAVAAAVSQSKNASRDSATKSSNPVTHLLSLFANSPLSANAIQGNMESAYARLPTRKKSKKKKAADKMESEDPASRTPEHSPTPAPALPL